MNKNKKEFDKELNNCNNFDFSKFNKKYKVIGYVDDLDDDKTVKRIPLNIPSLNQLFNGGLPLGRVIEIYGKESSGKSTLALQILADIQKANLKVMLIDTERCYLPKYGETLGIDNKKMILAHPLYGEEAFDLIHEMLLNEVKVIVVDSVAAMMPEEENTSESLGSQARMMSRHLRKLIPKLSEFNASVIFINQTRKNISIGFVSGPQETTPGGMALKFFSSIRIELKKVKTILDSEQEITGSEVKFNTVKNKMNSPFKSIILNLYNGKGFSKIMDIIKTAEEHKILIKNGSWFKYKEQSIAQGYDQLKDYLENNPKILDEISKTLLKI